jgi:hypothetical protein
MKKLEQIIAENILRFFPKNLSESDKELIKNLSEQEEPPSGFVGYGADDGTQTKSKSIGFATDRGRNRVRGKERGDVRGGINYSVTKEKDVELITPNDMLRKMSADLAESAEYKQLSIDIKTKLAEGYHDALLSILNSDFIQKLTIAQKRDMRKFFRKSQRWNFVTRPVNEDEYLKFKIQSNTELTPDQIKEAGMIINQSTNDINIANSSTDTIIATKANSIRIMNDDLEYSTREKDPLQTIMVTVEKGFGQKQLKAPSSDTFIQPITLTTPINTEVFKTGAFDVKAASEMVKTILTQILDQQFTVKSKKTSVTKTGREIVNGGGIFTAMTFNVISSASNFWGGEVDYTHENDGRQVKYSSQLDKSGNAGKNYKLSEKRNYELQNAVASQLNKIPWFNMNTVDTSNDVRVTNTGGKVDDGPAGKGRDKSKFPNPGQYAQFELSIGGSISYSEEKEGTYSRTGSFEQFMIELQYIGKRETKRSLTGSLVTSGPTKAAIVKARPIKAALQNLGILFSRDDGKVYHRKDALTPGSDIWQKTRMNKWQKSIGNK